MKPIDKTDRKILDVLQREGRISMTDLAERISLSVTPCTERVKRLEREGYISGYHAHLAPNQIGRGMLVFVELKMATKSDQVFNQVKRQIAGVAEVLECHLVAGDFDYLLKARIAEMSEYRSLLGNILLKLPGATESRSYVVMEELKETSYLDVHK